MKRYSHHVSLGLPHTIGKSGGVIVLPLAPNGYRQVPRAIRGADCKARVIKRRCRLFEHVLRTVGFLLGMSRPIAAKEGTRVHPTTAITVHDLM